MRWGREGEVEEEGEVGDGGRDGGGERKGRILILLLGQVVTFSYERRTFTDVPINPRIVKVREDLLWRDVLLNAHKEKRSLNGIKPLCFLFFSFLFCYFLLHCYYL